MVVAHSRLQRALEAPRLTTSEKCLESGGWVLLVRRATKLNALVFIQIAKFWVNLFGALHIPIRTGFLTALRLARPLLERNLCLSWPKELWEVTGTQGRDLQGHRAEIPQSSAFGRNTLVPLWSGWSLCASCPAKWPNLGWRSWGK